MYKILFGFLLSCTAAHSVFGEYVPSVPNWGVCGTQDETGNWNSKYQIDDLTFWSDFGVTEALHEMLPFLRVITDINDDGNIDADDAAVVCQNINDNSDESCKAFSWHEEFEAAVFFRNYCDDACDLSEQPNHYTFYENPNLTCGVTSLCDEPGVCCHAARVDYQNKGCCVDSTKAECVASACGC